MNSATFSALAPAIINTSPPIAGDCSTSGEPQPCWPSCKPREATSPRVREHRLCLLARVLTEPAAAPADGPIAGQGLGQAAINASSQAADLAPVRASWSQEAAASNRGCLKACQAAPLSPEGTSIAPAFLPTYGGPVANSGVGRTRGWTASLPGAPACLFWAYPVVTSKSLNRVLWIGAGSPLAGGFKLTIGG